jgi:hypothetical protein
MKKILFILVFVAAAVVVNAQRVKLPAEELPKAISDNLAKDHSGFTVKQAVWDWSTTLVPKNVFIYDIVITNGTNDEALYFDKDGKFLKKGVVKIEVEEPKPQRPPRPAGQKPQR